MTQQKINLEMEECRILMAFVNDFLDDNRGNKYGKFLTEALLMNIAEGVKKIDDKYKSLQKVKLGEHDKIMKDKKDGE